MVAGTEFTGKTFSPIRRQSRFRETGLEDDVPRVKSTHNSPTGKLRFQSESDILKHKTNQQSDTNNTTVDNAADQTHIQGQKQEEKNTVPARSVRARFGGSSTMCRFGAAAFAVAAALPLLQSLPWVGDANVSPIGVSGGPIRRNPNPIIETEVIRSIEKRDNSPTDVCTRWAHQTALVNGTLYIYGGEATTSPGQTSNTWNNDFLTLDLNTNWQISTPSLVGLPQPSGPPNISLGALWNSYQGLWLYGGEFSWQPVEDPTQFAAWEYNIAQSTWYEHSNPTTSSGQNSGPDGQSVQRSAEGAGISVPALGRAWYFGGHQDGYTTPNWSQSIYRIYLQSLLEFTFPGFANTQIDTLSNGQTAGTDGNWRNITQGGVQNTAGFPERADGLLQYIPGFGADGILIGLAGGTNTTYQQMNEVDVFDIATSSWYKQATSGETPEIRVNPCAVVAAAPDGSSYNVYMFGGQSLLPAGNQTQYNDMWILTIPSFTWIQVDTSSQSVPYARAGHTCNIWNGQMVVVGGYVGTELSCDSPGVYVFDTSNLKWIQQYNALSGTSTGSSGSGSSSAASSATSSVSSSKGSVSSASGSAGSAAGPSSTSGSSGSSSTFVSNAQNNPLNQQANQLSNGTSPGGLEGSYGYLVPAAVQSVIGGASTGGATITTPAQTATAGPLKTGKPVTYTVTTGANGAIVTETGTPGSSNSPPSGRNLAAIIAPSVIAGILLILVCYLAFCAWLYRKRLNIYKRHIEMVQERSSDQAEKLAYGGAGAALLRSGDTSNKPSSERRRIEAMLATSHSHESSSGRIGSASGSGSGNGYSSMRRSSGESVEDLIGADEPTFWGTLLAPKRSLRVVNRD